MASICIRNWERFQHYKDRDPPWVKLYRDLLTSESWVLGTDLSRVIQVASIVLAPRYSNQIPLRFDLLRKVMSLECKETEFTKAVKHLVDTGFVELQDVTEPVKVVEQSASSVLATCASEKIREDQSREEQSREEIHVEQELDAGPVAKVFSHWRTEFGHPKAVLDSKRRKVIEQALKSYDEATLIASISGYRHSAHHMGQNERQTVYDDIALFLRDATHVDAGLRFARGPPRQLSPVERVKARLNGNGNERVVSEQPGSSQSGLGTVSRMLRRLPDS
jgi:hypothetical protein